MSSMFSTLAIAAAASVAAVGVAQAQPQRAQPNPPQPNQGMANQGMANQGGPNLTQVCAFKSGPRAGQTVDFTGTPGSAAVPVGDRCADMQGSSGVTIAQSSARQQSPGRFYTSPGAPNAWSGGVLRRGFSLTCRFNSGPRAGTTLNYAHTLGAQPVAIGSPCSDGASRGVAVAAGTGS